jgi:hypothetical protein
MAARGREKTWRIEAPMGALDVFSATAVSHGIDEVPQASPVERNSNRPPLAFSHHKKRPIDWVVDTDCCMRLQSRLARHVQEDFL